MEDFTRTRVRGLELAYRTQGHGPTLLLIHAFPLNQRMWDGQVAALADHIHFITLDVRGFGMSQAVDATYTIDDVADDVAALAETMGHARLVVGGLSMGGYVAMALARRHPKLLRGLILADTRAGADTDEGRAKRLAQAEEALIVGTGPIANAMVPHMLTPATAANRPELVEQVRLWIKDAPPLAVAGALKAMAARADASTWLPEVKVPTLVLVGAGDDLTPPPEAEKIAALVPGAQVVRLPGAGHLANLEEPAAFNKALATFMAQFRD